MPHAHRSFVLPLFPSLQEYKPSKLAYGEPHPDAVVETASLSAVEPPDITYELAAYEELVGKTALSALQLEAVVYACQRHELTLPDGSRAGFFIGDGAVRRLGGCWRVWKPAGGGLPACLLACCRQPVVWQLVGACPAARLLPALCSDGTAAGPPQRTQSCRFAVLVCRAWARGAPLQVCLCVITPRAAAVPTERRKLHHPSHLFLAGALCACQREVVTAPLPPPSPSSPPPPCRPDPGELAPRPPPPPVAVGGRRPQV